MRKTIFQQLSDSSLRPLPFAVIVAVLSIIFGYSLGALFVNLQYITDFYILGESEIDVVFGTFILGGILGAFLGSGLCAGAGRRITLIGSAALGAGSSLATVFSPSFSVYLCSLLVMGVAFSLYTLSSLIYICEITLPSNRGFCACLLPVAFLLGVEIGIFTPDLRPSGEGFPLYLLLVMIHILALVIAILKLPESPRWLALSGYYDAALSVLFSLRNDMGIAARELAGVNECCRGEEKGSELFLQNTNFRKIVWLLLSLVLFIQLSGIVILPYTFSDLMIKTSYSKDFYMFSYSYDLLKASLTVALFGAVTAMFTVDRCGRRIPMIISAAVCAITLFGLCLISFSKIEIVSMAIISILIVMFIYSASVFLCCFMAVLVCEVIPLRGREFGIAMVLLVNYVTILLCLQLFLSVILTLDFKGLFFIEFIAAAVLCNITYNFVPNTNDSSIENIENRLFAGRDLVNLGKGVKH